MKGMGYFMKRIPDCPGGMGNANDWIKAREALGFPQNRTVSYEYTTYDYGGTDTAELVKQAHEDDNDYANDMYDMGFEHGYDAGYKQACIDIEKCLETNLSTKAIKTTLKNLGVEHYYNAQVARRLLIVEGSTDVEMLRAFAKKVNHPVKDILEGPIFTFYTQNVNPKETSGDRIERIVE